jgi:hypothetical protein
MLLVVSVLAGCGLLFGAAFEIDYEVDVRRVDTVSDSGGTVVSCDLVITAVAIGEVGERAKWGESLWTLRRISDGSIYSEETTSAAVMQFYFGTLDIEAGESLTTSLIHRTADAPFEWEFSLNYRKPGGARATVNVTAVCALVLRH